MKESDSVDVEVSTERTIHVKIRKPLETYKVPVIMDERRVNGPAHLVQREFEFPQALDRTKGDWEISNGQLKIMLTKLGTSVKLGRKIVQAAGAAEERSAKRTKEEAKQTQQS